MNGKKHFICLRGIVQALIFIREPQQLLFAIPLADVDAKVNEGSIDLIVHRIGLRGVLIIDTPIDAKARRNLRGVAICGVVLSKLMGIR